MDRPPSKPVGVRLGLPQEDRWLDLVYGVRVCVRLLTTAIYEAAQFTGQRQALAVAIEHCLLLLLLLLLL